MRALWLPALPVGWGSRRWGWGRCQATGCSSECNGTAVLVPIIRAWRRLQAAAAAARFRCCL
jgi:hypothetical protein